MSCRESARSYRWLIVLASILLQFMAGEVSSFQPISISPSNVPPTIQNKQILASTTKTIDNTLRLSALFGKKDARKGGNANTSNSNERVRKPRDDVIEVEAIVQESLPNAMFRCALSNGAENQPIILATISGKIRKNFVKILVGDRVLIELSPYDLTRGRITFRYRS